MSLGRAPVEGGGEASERRREVMEVAATQIDLAIREADDPIERLGLAIGRISELLSEAASRPRMGGAIDPVTSRRVGIDERDRRLRDEIDVCIESLQVFDRLAQHLVLIRNLLVGGGDGPREPERRDARWAEACASFRARLLSERQKELFDLIVNDSVQSESGYGRGECQPRGSVELF